MRSFLAYILVCLILGMTMSRPVMAQIQVQAVVPDTVITLVGTGIPSDTVTVKMASVVIGTTTVDSLGHWSATFSDQIPGTYTYTIYATDPSWNQTTASSSVVIVAPDHVTTTSPLINLAPLWATGTASAIQGGILHTSGKGTPGSLISLFFTSDLIHPVIQVTVASDASFTIDYTLPMSLVSGTYALTATITSGSEVSAYSNTQTLYIQPSDITPTAIPTPTPTSSPSSSSSSSSSTTSTSNTQPSSTPTPTSFFSNFTYDTPRVPTPSCTLTPARLCLFTSTDGSIDVPRYVNLFTDIIIGKTRNETADINSDGAVDGQDLSLVLSQAQKPSITPVIEDTGIHPVMALADQSPAYVSPFIPRLTNTLQSTLVAFFTAVALTGLGLVIFATGLRLVLSRKYLHPGAHLVPVSLFLLMTGTFIMSYLSLLELTKVPSVEDLYLQPTVGAIKELTLQLNTLQQPVNVAEIALTYDQTKTHLSIVPPTTPPDIMIPIVSHESTGDIMRIYIGSYLHPLPSELTLLSRSLVPGSTTVKIDPARSRYYQLDSSAHVLTPVTNTVLLTAQSVSAVGQ